MNKKANKYLSGNVIIKDQQDFGPLVLGDCNSALDVGIIKVNRILTILSLGVQAQPPKHKIPSEIQHFVYDVHDNKQQKLSVQFLDETFDIIEKGRARGGVLVHCYAGVSRSSSIVIAYLIRKYLLSFDQAKEKAKKQRPCVHPGDGFVRQLQYYAKIIFKRQQERLAKLNQQKVQKVQIEEVKRPIEPKVQIKNQSVILTQRTKRGVRGAVRSAENVSPQKLKSSVMQKSLLHSKRMQEIRQEQKTSARSKQKEQNSDKLPPIHKQGFVQSKYERSNSKMEIKQKIDKIEGKQTMISIPSIREIYSNKTKVI